MFPLVNDAVDVRTLPKKRETIYAGGVAMAKKSTYKDIPAFLTAMAAFTGNSMSAKWVGDSYFVYSYETVIASWTARLGAIHNHRKYSTTTSRHQNLCRQYLPLCRQYLPERVPLLIVSYEIKYGDEQQDREA